MTSILNKNNLENKFADDFSSPLFPILAETYFLEGDIRRAKTVCEVGLEHDQYNTDGKFILAKIYIFEEQFVLAEKLLKNVIYHNPAHFKAIRMLIDLEIKLNRSPRTIKVYINKLLIILPHDAECKKWLKDLGLDEQISTDNSFKKTKDSNNPQHIDTLKKNLLNNNKIEYDVDESMATFTMVAVLKSQKHYKQALSLLKTLESIGQDKNKVLSERKEIENILAKSDN